MPLAGRTIVVTRPREQAESLLRQVRAAGARAIDFAVIDIAPLEDAAPLHALAARLGDYDLAFFVSPNAVSHALSALPRPQWPPHLTIATVGPGSAKALREAGFDAVIVPTDRFDSESVLALPAFAEHAVRGRRIVILRGDGGRELLADTLRARGAQVDAVTCYRRRRATLDTAPLRTLWAAGELDALVFTSSEGVRYFAELLGAEVGAILNETALFAPHPRIGEALAVHGAQHVILTGPGDEGILTALHKHFG
ncbi:MAG: uroporphyrinogen-III synthase [Rhodocyclaceae bacterium]